MKLYNTELATLSALTNNTDSYIKSSGVGTYCLVPSMTSVSHRSVTRLEKAGILEVTVYGYSLTAQFKELVDRDGCALAAEAAAKHMAV